jgi:hypothetical protein
MRISLLIPRCSLSLLMGALMVAGAQAWAEPFSATFTNRESKAITAIAPTAPFTRTYAALTQESKDLSFYESTSGRLFLAFSSLDGTLDNLGTNRCSTTTEYQVYWVDKFQNLPAECLSTSVITGANGNNHSTHPLIGGSGRDEGRYVAYETTATDVIMFLPTPVPPALRPLGSQQVAVHDRKWGQNYPSGSKCDVEDFMVKGARDDLDLWQISDDGKSLLLTTRATNMRDNLVPNCQDANSVSDIFIRDGSDCVEGMKGACKTSILFDSFGYHTDPNLKETLDEDSANIQMTPDLSVVVFDTRSTNPMYFSPDTKDKRDVYYHTKNQFSRITEAMVPFCSVTGSLLPLTNDYGPANGDSERPSVDGTGRYVAFESDATDLVVWEGNPAMKCSTPGAPHPADIQYIENNGNRQVYLYDHLNKKIKMVSARYRSDKSARMEGGNGSSGNARISRDGRFIVFESTSTDLVKTIATTPRKNIFVYDTYLEETFLVTPGTGGTGLNQDADLTHVSPTGLTVAFQTHAIDVVVEGPSQGTATGGTVQLCGGGTSTCVQHVYIARHSCPLDTDGDLVPDCLDACKNDLNKTEPKLCGCGVSEVDSDVDFSPDCLDACDADPKKTTPGQCGCGKVDTDTEGDGTADCVDKCPTDNSKIDPGSCGCGKVDVDTDKDGSLDCNDSCPTDPAKSGKGGCPCGSLKNVPGVCGCNVADTDANGNGQADCLDPTAATQPAAASYVASKVNLSKGKKLNILRIKMQSFGGKNVYSYSLTKSGYSLQKTSKSASIAVKGLPSGTYTFSYNITSGSGATKITTKTTTTTLKVN